MIEKMIKYFTLMLCMFLQYGHQQFIVVDSFQQTVVTIPQRKYSRQPNAAPIFRYATTTSTNTNTNNMMKGSGANPIRDKKKIVMLGGGGYLGGIIFGFLQRCMALSYETGIILPRCLGCTADTSIRLNKILGKCFGNAQVDESYIQLTNLQNDVNHIQQRLIGYNAIVFGLDDYYIQQRTITGNTYEKTSNEKTWELYWGLPQGAYYVSDNEKQIENEIILKTLINLIEAVKMTPTIQHAFIVSSPSNNNNNNIIMNIIKESKIPYTLIQTNSISYQTETNNYSYQAGIQNDISIKMDTMMDKNNDDVSSLVPLCVEDLAAFVVQCIQSVDWNKSRTLYVSSNGPLTTTTTMSTNNNKLRIDQQWCVNSFIFKEKLYQFFESQ